MPDLEARRAVVATELELMPHRPVALIPPTAQVTTRTPVAARHDPSSTITPASQHLATAQAEFVNQRTNPEAVVFGAKTATAMRIVNKYPC